MDIQNGEDLLRLVKRFYAKLLPDPLVGHFFTSVIELDLEAHLPRLVGFWQQILFGQGDYQGNPMHVHMHLNSLSPMRLEHFHRWLALFVESVDELFQGPVAEMAKQRAHTISEIMKVKVGAG